MANSTKPIPVKTIWFPEQPAQSIHGMGLCRTVGEKHGYKIELWPWARHFRIEKLGDNPGVCFVHESRALRWEPGDEPPSE